MVSRFTSIRFLLCLACLAVVSGVEDKPSKSDPNNKKAKAKEQSVLPDAKELRAEPPEGFHNLHGQHQGGHHDGHHAGHHDEHHQQGQLHNRRHHQQLPGYGLPLGPTPLGGFRGPQPYPYPQGYLTRRQDILGGLNLNGLTELLAGYLAQIQAQQEEAAAAKAAQEEYERQQGQQGEHHGQQGGHHGQQGEHHGQQGEHHGQQGEHNGQHGQQGGNHNQQHQGHVNPHQGHVNQNQLRNHQQNQRTHQGPTLNQHNLAIHPQKQGQGHARHPNQGFQQGNIRNQGQHQLHNQHNLQNQQGQGQNHGRGQQDPIGGYGQQYGGQGQDYGLYGIPQEALGSIPYVPPEYRVPFGYNPQNEEEVLRQQGQQRQNRGQGVGPNPNQGPALQGGHRNLEQPPYGIPLEENFRRQDQNGNRPRQGHRRSQASEVNAVTDVTTDKNDKE